MNKVRLVFITLALLGLFACNGGNEPDPEPVTQQIVYSDTSGVTGELLADVKYYSGGSVLQAPSGIIVSIYATFEDANNGLSLYDLWTDNEGQVYFGFLNYGNYYVSASGQIGASTYGNIEAVQIRPGRQEYLTITMYP